MGKDDKNLSNYVGGNLLKKQFPPKPARNKWFQKNQTKRLEEYHKTLKAANMCVDEYGNLQETIADLGNLPIKNEKRREGLISELNKIKNSRETTRRDELANQDEADARAWEAKYRIEQAKKGIYDLNQQPQTKNRKSDSERYAERLDKQSGSCQKREQAIQRMNEEIAEAEKYMTQNNYQILLIV